MNNDIISIQEAIDALLHNQEVYSHNYGEDPIDKYTVAIIDNDIQTIAQLSPAQQWIPIKYRQMTDEEREYFEEHGLFALTDKDAIIFDCAMPDDGQEILISTKSGYVMSDVCRIDDGHYLEDRGDFDGVSAWMPLPEPYKDEEGRGQ